MNVLLVEPDFRRRLPSISGAPDDELLWYPPIGLLKLARYHMERGDTVRFVSGCDAKVLPGRLEFEPQKRLSRVYITTLFTFHFQQIVNTIRFYLDAVGGTKDRIFVGGVMSSLMRNDIFEATGIYPISGILTNSSMIGFDDDVNIDSLAPDYSLLDKAVYAINDTFYGYTTRGCTNSCKWCGVPFIEPRYIPYIDIKPIIQAMRSEYGDLSVLRLMDNNVLASPDLSRIVADLVELGYGRGEMTSGHPRKQRVVDFNQGLDASHLTESTMKLIEQINVKPLRIAFDRITERNDYVSAVKLARRRGVVEFSNYMLYNYRDTPRDLYERLLVNINLNEDMVSESQIHRAGKIFSYPMRYAPITNSNGLQENRERDFIQDNNAEDTNWGEDPKWTRRFIRNIEIMKGAAHGAISPTPGLAKRTIGRTFNEFVENLYMPEELLRNRNRYEKKIYPEEPRRVPGNGKVEEFRRFIRKLIEERTSEFYEFHYAVSENTADSIRRALKSAKDSEFKEWLAWYIKR